MDSFKEKYLKYKKKYTKLLKQKGGQYNNNQKIINEKTEICYPNNDNNLTKERLELLAKSIEAFNAKDWDKLLEPYADNFESFVGNKLVVRGKTNYKKMMDLGQTITPDAIVLPFENAFGCGNWTCVTGIMKATKPNKEQKPENIFKNRNVVICKWEGKKIIKEWSYWEMDMNKSMGVDTALEFNPPAFMEPYEYT